MKKVTDLGMQQEAIQKYHANIDRFDPGRGKHMWTMMVLHFVADPEKVMNEQVLLDLESLMTIEGPGCFKCEQLYSPELAKKWCNGV